MQQHLTTQAVVYSAKNDAEKSFDYILPEYLPGISRIVKASAYPEKCTFFAAIGETSMRLLLKMSIIYISEYDGRIKSFAFTEEFTVPFSEPFDFSGEFTAVPSCFVSSVAAFVQTQRKLTLKLKLQTSVTAYSQKDVALFPSSEDNNICLLKDAVTAYSKKLLPETYFEKTEEISVGGIKGSISEIIHTDTLVSDSRITVSEGRADFEADVRLCVLAECFDDNSGDISYTSFDTVVKIQDSLICDSLKDGDVPFIYMDVHSAEPSVSLDAYGENKLVLLVIRFSVSGFAYEKSQCELVTDAFIQNCPDNPEFSSLDIDDVHSIISASKPVSQAVRADIREISEISSCNAKIHSVSIEHSEGQFFAVARCTAGILGTNLSGELMSVQTPVLLHIPLGGEGLIPSDILPEVIVNITDCKAEIKDGGLNLDFIVSLNGVFILRTRHRIVSSFKTDSSEFAKKSSVIRVYYPAKSEKLWDIAKKYRISPEDICSANGGDEKALDGKHTLIIP